MGLISLNRKLLQALTLFYLSICSSLSVYGSHLSFDESQCQNQIPNDTFSVQCSQNSTILFEMIEKFRQITIHCHEENPFYSKFLPKLNNQNSTSYNVSLSSCKFPAHENVQNILKNKLGILEIGILDFNNEFIDYFPTSVNLKGLAGVTNVNFKFKSLSTIPKDFFVALKMLKFLQISSRTSSQLPAIFDPLENIKWLHIIDNNFQYIPEKIFKNMRKLQHLFLSRNNLTTITKGAWEGLENLSLLDLSFNNIQTLQPEVFSNLINLLEIDLSGNNFTSLPKDHSNESAILSSTKLGKQKNQVDLNQLPENLLHNLLKLRVFTINNCQLDYISSNFFENLRNLDKVDISGNNLEELPLGLFDHQVKLTSLNLSENKIHTLSDGLFKNTRKLMYLDLSNNQLKFLSNDIFKHLTQLQELNLAQNLLGTSFNHNHLQSRSPFDYLRNLDMLVLTNNSINKLFNTKLHLNEKEVHIDLSFNNIESINCDYVQYLKFSEFTENPLHCDCEIRCLYMLLTNSWSRSKRTFKCQTPQVLKGRDFTDLKLTELQCKLETHQMSFLKKCSNECLYSILDSYLTMNCSNGNLTKMPVLPEFDPSISNGIKLFIQGNQISELAPNTLQDYQNISEFSISNRLIPKLPKGYFSNLLKLERVHIDLQLLDIPNDLFVGSTAIEEIEITGMNLESLPKAIFESQTGLITLYLQGNGLRKLEEYGFSSNINLETLDLSHNLLESLTELMFYQLRNLKSLFLGNNRLHDVSPSAFKYTNSLSEIGMENNLMTTFEPLAELNRLIKVNLSFNNISSFELSDLVKELNNGYTQERQFNFNYNNIRTITVKKSDTYFSYFTELEFGYNPFNCDCNIISFVKFTTETYTKKYLKNLQCMTPAELKNKFVSELQLNELVCQSKKCPQGCQCWDQPYDSILIVNCSNANLTDVPELTELELAPLNQIALSIEFNQLKRLNLYPESRCQHVTKIFAAHNMIDYISTSDIPRNLSYLDLSYNNLERLDTDVINKLTESQNIHFIRLSQNPWKCDCSSEKLKQFILLNKTRILDWNETFCADGQTFENLSFVDMLCYVETDHTVSVISIALGIVGLSICLLTILFFKNKERVLIWMYAQGICLWWVTEEDLDKNKKYDAFVSYSSLDTDFVVSKFLPKLEDGPTPFKLCLHDRDWIVGAYIPDQIQKSVEYSKRTIILMSQNYLKSKWTRLEFRTAHNHALNDKLSRVIVVIIGDIGDVEDLDSDLRKYIKMYTYLRWDDPWFWKKLRYAMPHQTRRNHQNEDTEM